MSDPRTIVYVADHGLVKVQDGINIRMAGLVLETHPAVAKYPNDLRLVGTVDAQTAAHITMLGDSATLPLYRDRITPIGSEPSESSSPQAVAADPGRDWSPNSLPNFAEAYRECIAALTTAHRALTWDAVAVWLQDKYEPPLRLDKNDIPRDLHPKTVAEWAKRAGLPHPKEYRLK